MAKHVQWSNKSGRTLKVTTGAATNPTATAELTALFRPANPRHRVVFAELSPTRNTNPDKRVRTDMAATRNTPQQADSGSGSPAQAARAALVLAKVRCRQLDLAIRGRFRASSRYARWAQKVRRQTA